MAFEQRTWTDREVQYPGRRTLTNIEDASDIKQVDVERAEGTITTPGDLYQAGDPTNPAAGTMNDLEKRIADAFEAVTQSINSAINDVYPVGAILMSYEDLKLENANQTVFPGTTWQLLPNNRVLYPVPTNQSSGQPTGNTNNQVSFTPTSGLYLYGTVGGTVLTIEQIPAHTHTARMMLSGGSATAAWWSTTTGPSVVIKTKPSRSTGENGYNYAHSHGFSASGSISFKPITIDVTQPYMTIHAWRRIS